MQPSSVRAEIYNFGHCCIIGYIREERALLQDGTFSSCDTYNIFADDASHSITTYVVKYTIPHDVQKFSSMTIIGGALRRGREMMD